MHSAAVQADELLKIMDGEIMEGEGDGGGWETHEEARIGIGGSVWA